MRKPLLLAIPALFAATSCVPAAKPAQTAAQVAAAPVTDSRLLLKKLDLDVPDDLPPQPQLPPRPAGRGALPFVASAQSADDATRAEDCLTAAVYYEARSESTDGQRAVAQVVLNRVRDRAFPGSVCGVVYQGSNRRTGCQFSFTCDGSMYRPRDPGAWARASAIAQAALAGDVYAPVGTATYYHANYVLPWWASSLTRIGSVGAHIFYRWRDGMERALSFRQDYAGVEPSVSAGGTAGAAADVLAEAGTVVIHRGNDAVTAVAPRLATVAGVRVHRGVDPNTDDGESPIVAEEM